MREWRASLTRGDGRDDGDGDDDVPRALAQRRGRKRRREVVRQEQRRQRDDDEVVEEERPAGREAGEVVERAPGERRGAAGLGDRGRALRVRERDDEEEEAGREQDDRRQAERLRRDDPEREVDRGADLVVRGREERRRVEDALEAADLTRHRLRSSCSRPTPSATKSAPRTKPTRPPPLIAVITSNARPMTTKTTEKT